MLPTDDPYELLNAAIARVTATPPHELSSWPHGVTKRASKHTILILRSILRARAAHLHQALAIIEAILAIPTGPDQ